MNYKLSDYQEVGNVRVLFKIVKKVINDREIEFIDTLLVFPDGHDYLLNPMYRYSKSVKCLFRTSVKSVL